MSRLFKLMRFKRQKILKKLNDALKVCGILKIVIYRQLLLIAILLTLYVVKPGSLFYERLSLVAHKKQKIMVFPTDSSL